MPVTLKNVLRNTTKSDLDDYFFSPAISKTALTNVMQSGSSNVTFTCGAWSEAHDILGVSDDSDMLYFIKVNGEEISRIGKRHLKLSFPIIDLIVGDDSNNKKSCL